MAKFSVTFERRFWQMETVTIEVEAAGPVGARKIAREKLHTSEVQEHPKWEAGEGNYDHYRVEGVYDTRNVAVDE